MRAKRESKGDFLKVVTKIARKRKCECAREMVHLAAVLSPDSTI